MKILVVLLAKDLRRAWRNPAAYAIHLAVPLVITALIGLAFSPSAPSGGLGRIKLGIVDEDESVLSQFLLGAINQGEAAKYLEPIFLSRPEAERRIADNELSAVVILPRGFAEDYLVGGKRVSLVLIKNPAQSFYPAIVEELLLTLTTGLNAVDRHLRPELREWQVLFERTERPSPGELAELVTRTGDRLEAAADYIYPPLITYTTLAQDAEQTSAPGPTAPDRAPTSSVFAFILPGLAAMFLLFIADNALRDLYREQRFRTFERFRTLRQDILTFVGAKVIFTIVILLISSLILFGGGSLVFGIQWKNPGSLGVLVIAYAAFAAGFMAVVAALAGTEKRADTFNTIVAMGMGLIGGCMFPREQLPAFVSEQLTPWMPTYWFASAARAIHWGDSSVSWLGSAGLLVTGGLALVILAAWLFQGRMFKGATS